MGATITVVYEILEGYQQYHFIYEPAIEKQISKFNVDPDTYLELRRDIFNFITEHMNFRKVDGPIDPLSLKCGWKNHLKATKPKVRKPIDLYHCFGQPHIYLQAGPDVSM